MGGEVVWKVWGGIWRRGGVVSEVWWGGMGEGCGVVGVDGEGVVGYGGWVGSGGVEVVYMEEGWW